MKPAGRGDLREEEKETVAVARAGARTGKTAPCPLTAGLGPKWADPTGGPRPEAIRAHRRPAKVITLESQ